MKRVGKGNYSFCRPGGRKRCSRRASVGLGCSWPLGGECPTLHSIWVAGHAFGRGALQVPPLFPCGIRAHPSPPGKKGQEPRGQRQA